VLSWAGVLRRSRPVGVSSLGAGLSTREGQSQHKGRHMSQWPHSGTRPKSLVWLAGITVALLLVANAALAAISPFKPSEGTVEPGEKAKTHFNVVDSVTSCFVATAPSDFSVSFDGLGLGILPASCALNGARVTLTVTASSQASPGAYKVTITETSQGGSLIDTHEWPFTVPAPPPPTTTTMPIETTTTVPPSVTTIAPGVATTTSTPSSSPTSTVGSASSPTTVGASSSPANPVGPAASPGAGAGSPSTGTSRPTEDAPRPQQRDAEDVTRLPTDETSPDDEAEVLAAGVSDDSSPPYDRYPRRPQADGSESEEGLALSDPLRDQNSNPVAMFMADGDLSPGAIAQFIFGSLFEGAKDLMIPLLIATLVGLVMVWRMRSEVEGDELALSRQSLG
jgi:hypothetical protein